MAKQTTGATPVRFQSKRRNESLPDVEDVEANELWDFRADVVVVDVRRPDEFTGELGHVPGARLITLDTLPQRLGELPVDRAIVFVCRSGQRSARATAFAHQNGYADAYNMAGGMLRWNELSLTTENGDA